MIDRYKRALKAGVAALVLVFAGTAADAAPVFTQDEAAFNAATAGLTFTTETFDTAPLGDLGTIEAFNGFTLAASSTISGLDSSTFCLTPNCISIGSSSSPYTLIFDTPVNAVGFFIGDGNGETSDFLVDGTVVGTITTPGSGFTFVGVYDFMNSFTEVTVEDFLIIHELENVSFASGSPSAPIPEPGTLALIGTGLAGLGIAARRRRKG